MRGEVVMWRRSKACGMLSIGLLLLGAGCADESGGSSSESQPRGSEISRDAGAPGRAGRDASMGTQDVRIVDATRRDAAEGDGQTPGAADGALMDGGAHAIGDRGLQPAADAAGTDGEADAVPADGAICGEITGQAQAARRPVDIVWIIDSSPSMRNEIAIIQDKLNAFTARIAESGLDYRVGLVGAEQDLQTPGRDYFGICIPPPLSGAPGCPDTDSEIYRHVREPVHSANGLDILLGAVGQLQGFLRPDARLHVVMVSDDDHRQNVTLADLTGAGLGMDLVFHSIVTLIDYVDGCGVFDPDEICSCGDERGRRYIALSEGTGGLVLDLCEADWDPLFGALNAQVEMGAGIPCAFDIPEVRGAVIDPDRINVDFVAPDGTRTPLFNTDDCQTHPEGWQFDDPDHPTRVLLCPEACGDIEGEVHIEFGCEIRKLP